MKLHLPKLLSVALFAAYALPAMGANLKDGSIKESNGYKYLNVGTDPATDTWKESGGFFGIGASYGSLTVGGENKNVDYVGAFDSNYNFIKPDGETTITSGLKAGNVTVNEGGKILLGGQNGGTYYGLESTGTITVSGGELQATRIIAQELNVNSGSVKTSTDNCTGGNAYIHTPLVSPANKQSQIEDKITLSGGYLEFGYNNAQKIGNGEHYMTSFGSAVNGITISQSGGDMLVMADAIMTAGSVISQSDNSGKMVFRDQLKIQNFGTTTFTQSSNSAKLVFGHLKGDSTNNFVINQTGNGFVQLTYGSSFGQDSTISLNQQAGGIIKIGGNHDTELVFDIPTNHKNSGFYKANFESTNTTYKINQSGTGSISIESDASIKADTVNVGANSDLIVNGNLNIATGTSETDSAKLNGDVSGTGTVTQTAGKITVGETGTISVSNMSVNGTLENNGTISSNTTVTAYGKLTNNEGGVISGDITVSGGSFVNKGTVEIAATQPSLLPAADGDIATLSEADDMLKLTITGGQVENHGKFNGAISVEGGILNLIKGSVGDITMTAGDIVVHNESFTGNLTLNGGTITFMKGAILNVADNAVVDLNDVKVFVMVEDLDALAVGDVIKLFNLSTDTMEFNNTIITFTDGENYVEAPVSGAEGGSAAGGTVTVVPEPTTATLSLLALAALAARRRRR